MRSPGGAPPPAASAIRALRPGPADTRWQLDFCPSAGGAGVCSTWKKGQQGLYCTARRAWVRTGEAEPPPPDGMPACRACAFTDGQ